MKKVQSSLKTQHKGHKSVLLQLWLRDYVAVETVERLAQEDIMVRSPSGVHFGLEVKTMQKPNWWQIGKRPDEHSSRVWVFVTLNQTGDPDAGSIDHFVLTREEVQNFWDNEDWNRKNEIRCGIRHRVLKEHIDRWNKLPE